MKMQASHASKLMSASAMTIANLRKYVRGAKTAAAAGKGKEPAAKEAGDKKGPGFRIDVLKFLKKGCPLLKFGKYGYPHFRQFQLSNDNRKVMWFSSAKKMSDSQIDLGDIEELVMGQSTEIFARHEAEKLAATSFSVIYSDRKKTLDVIAKDPNEFLLWTRGLNELVARLKSGQNLGTLEELILTLPLRTGTRVNPDIIDADTGRPIAEIAAAKAAGASGKEDMTSSYDKGSYKQVAQSFTDLKARYAKYQQKIKSQAYYLSPQYANMAAILEKVKASVDKVTDWFQLGQFGLCDDEIWRAGVEIESLKNMMKAIDNQNADG